MLENTGAPVDGIVCDREPTNRKMWVRQVVSGKLDKTNCFKHPVNTEHKVSAFSDVPDLFKCMRNRLLKRAMGKEDRIHGCKNVGGLKVCPQTAAVYAIYIKAIYTL